MDLNFSNAKKNLKDNYLTVSGFDPDEYWIWYEMYREAFMDKLSQLGCNTDAEYESILTQMNAFSDVGEFLYDEKLQIKELAAFGLIIFEKIIRAEKDEVTYPNLFSMHQQLNECYGYVTDGAARQNLARNAAYIRHKENRSMKAEVFAWLDSNMNNKKMDEAAAEIAGKLVPMTFRTVREWVGEWKKNQSVKSNQASKNGI